MVEIDKQNVLALIVDKNKQAVEKTIPKSLEAFRKIIGNNNIEVEIYKQAILIYDMDGLIKNLPITRYLDTDNGKKAIRGIFFIVGNDSYYGDYRDLTREEIEMFKNEFDLEYEEELEM